MPEDLNQDGTVDAFDLSILLGAWVTADATADINNDGTVDTFDLSMLLNEWGVTVLTVTAVSASGEDTGSEADKAVDDDLGTWWSVAGDGEWLQADLGSTQEIGSLLLAFYRGDLRLAWFDIQTSTDGTSFTTVHYGQSSGDTLERQRFHFPETTARYVRYLGHGNSENIANSVTELQILSGDSQAAPPAAPVVSTAASDTAITVTWEPGYGSAPDSYTLERATSGTGPWTVLLSNTAAQTYDDTTAVTDTDYWYRVSATNQDGAASATTGPVQLSQETVVWDLNLDQWSSGQLTQARLESTGLTLPFGIRFPERSAVLSQAPWESSGSNVLECRHIKQTSSTELQNDMFGFGGDLPVAQNELQSAILEYDLAFGLGVDGLGFDFSKPGGKLPGLAGAALGYYAAWSCRDTDGTQYGDSVDNLSDKTPGSDTGGIAAGFSARSMWRHQDHQGNEQSPPRTMLMAYMYHANKTQTCGANYSFDGMTGLQTQTWYRFRQQIDMNDAGVANGRLRTWINDVLVQDDSTFMFRTENTFGITQIKFSPYFGGADPSWGHGHQEELMYFRNVRVLQP